MSEQWLMPPFNRCEKQGTKQWKNLPKVPELTGGEPGLFFLKKKKKKKQRY